MKHNFKILSMMFFVYFSTEHCYSGNNQNLINETVDLRNRPEAFRLQRREVSVPIIQEDLRNKFGEIGRNVQNINDPNQIREAFNNLGPDMTLEQKVKFLQLNLIRLKLDNQNVGNLVLEYQKQVNALQSSLSWALHIPIRIETNHEYFEYLIRSRLTRNFTRIFLNINDESQVENGIGLAVGVAGDGMDIISSCIEIGHHSLKAAGYILPPLGIAVAVVDLTYSIGAAIDNIQAAQQDARRQANSDTFFCSLSHIEKVSWEITMALSVIYSKQIALLTRESVHTYVNVMMDTINAYIYKRSEERRIGINPIQPNEIILALANTYAHKNTDTQFNILTLNNGGSVRAIDWLLATKMEVRDTLNNNIERNVLKQRAIVNRHYFSYLKPKKWSMHPNDQFRMFHYATLEGQNDVANAPPVGQGNYPNRIVSQAYVDKLAKAILGNNVIPQLPVNVRVDYGNVRLEILP